MNAKLPLHKSKAVPFDGYGEYYNFEFVGFNKPKNSCGKTMLAFAPVLNPDFTPISTFYNTVFTDQVAEAFTFWDPPKQSWANDEDCVEFPCTGPHNMAARFKNTRFGGANSPYGIPANFQIVSNNKESISSSVIPGCTLHSMWNAYLCTNDNIGQITFDSLDADRMDRSVQPVYIREPNSGFDNKLNSYMDHCWDGFYTCQQRETKFPTIIDTDWKEFEIEYTGTPPNAQEFRYIGKSDAPGKLISIKYPNAGAYQILDASRVPL